VVTLFAVSIIILIVYLKRQHKKTIGVTTSQVAETATLDSEKRTILNEISKCKSLTMRSEISFKEIVVEKKIGEGSYGRMFLAKWNEAPVALKFCRNKGSVDDFISEIKIFIELPPHPNVVQMFGISLDGPQPVIVMEYCSGGSLDQLLFDKQGEQTITNERKIELVRGIARGALHLHKHNIVHRDLAARNILITSGGDPKIADFGMSRILEHTDEGKTKSGVGPLCWMAPESIATRIYSKKSDVWSFGIVVYEIVAQCEPHKNMNVLDVAVAIRDHGLTPKIPDNCPSLLREVMEMCWKKEPSERPVSSPSVPIYIHVLFPQTLASFTF
jgi:serine/threonine protein kinase